MNSMKKNVIKITLGSIIIILSIVLGLFNQFSHKGIMVKEWDNYYNEDNILFFYSDSLDERIQFLEKQFNLSQEVENEKQELDKIIKLSKYLNVIIERDDVKDTTANNAYDILQKKDKEGSKKVSQKDYAIIMRDMLTAINIKSRVGYFRCGDSQFNVNNQYYIIEYWSDELSKWIAIDCIDSGYFMQDDSKLSALEVVQLGAKEISYLGNSSQKDHKNFLNKYLDSYTIYIDNTVIRNKSNVEVCYLKNEKALEINWYKKYAPPLIFTQSEELFSRSPYNTSVAKDEKAYIIANLINIKSENEDKQELGTLITVFKDGSVMNEYYLSFDNNEYEKVNKYKEVKLEKGITTISASIDGKNELCKIKIDNNQ